MRGLALLRQFSILPVFVMLFASPAQAQAPSQNGYPELIRAAELLSESRLFPRVEAGSAPLALQREALAERSVHSALELLKRALARPAVVPPPAADVDSPLKASGQLRRLARLIRVQQYVLLADGRTRDAVLAARLGLRLGTAAQGDTLITGLTGIGISATGMLGLGQHLDQLSFADCGLLYQVCEEWLGQPDPLLRVLEGERRFGKRQLELQFKEALREEVGGTPEDRRKAQQAVAEQLATITKELDALYDRLLHELRKPPWSREPIRLAISDGPAAVVAGNLLPVLNRSLDSYTREMAHVRLLACHAAILRYRWERDKVPATLGELQLADLAIDPFTGQSLRYERLSDRRYRLTSAGPRTTENNPRAVDGRLPVSVTPD